MHRSIIANTVWLLFVAISAALLTACSSANADEKGAPVARLKVADGFRVEQIYTVPRDRQGSWVNMCVDPRGRLIVSDQYGGLFRVTPPPIGTQEAAKVEKIDVDIGEAQGLLWAFDALYVVVNKGAKYASGLYRVTDTNDDDRLDKLETLRLLDGASEHGPHAVLLAPDGRSLVVVCGNRTKLTDLAESHVPRNWDEDILLPRPDGNGFMQGTPAPGACIYQVDPDGKNWTLLASGLRNPYDAAFSADGELFAYDADAEGDIGTPWYRPTRVCHVVSGAEFGWRSSGGKWPAYFPDSAPPVVNVGPGSPTGVCFGYGAKFPAKYQNALFICDWSYGKLRAVHLSANGASYRGELESFLTGAPLPLTDVVIRPQDGAMYFTVGGRKVQSGLYRVRYIGSESTAAVDGHQRQGAAARATRAKLEKLHNGLHYDAVQIAWPYLKNEDRAIRYAARVAIEHRHRDEWRNRALQEQNVQASLEALLALARSCRRTERGADKVLDRPPPSYDEKTGPDARFAKLQGQILDALAAHDWARFSPQQRVLLLRTFAVTFCRTGPPTAQRRAALSERLNAAMPADSYPVNALLAQLLVYLQAPAATPKIVNLLLAAPTQEQQLEYAKTLRFARGGWTPALRQKYFRWFGRAANYGGGAGLPMYVSDIRKDAVARLSAAEARALAPILSAKPPAELSFVEGPPRRFVKKWTVAELAPLVEKKLKVRDFDRGKRMFAAARCFACHRFDGQGGAVGPDLTALAGRFGPRDILESIVEPSKEISDQYAAVNITTRAGKVVSGRIVNLAGDEYRLSTDMLDPGAQTLINIQDIDEITPSKTSPMPEGLLNTLHEDEILDLLAYLLSRGDRTNDMFYDD